MCSPCGVAESLSDAGCGAVEPHSSAACGAVSVSTPASAHPAASSSDPGPRIQETDFIDDFGDSDWNFDAAVQEQIADDELLESEMLAHFEASESPFELRGSAEVSADRGFTLDQLEVWARVEREAGLRHSAKTKAPHTAPDLATEISVSGAFTASKRFIGYRSGFHFTTGEEGTGYYASTSGGASLDTPVVLSLDALIPPSHAQHHVFAKRRARHRICKNGKRFRPNTRAARQTHHADTAAVEVSANHTEIEDASWREMGLWAFDTANANSWLTGLNAVLKRSTADAVLMQESKIHSEAKLESARKDARKCGWNSSLSLAHRTAAERGSGGCTVAVQRGTGITPCADSTIPDGMRHRMHFAWSACACRGGVHLGSIWLRDSEGLSADNMMLLEQVAAVLQQLRGPWILGGDWNISPELLTSSNWPRLVDGVVFAPNAPTCHTSTYDYFVVSSGLAPAVAAVRRIDDGGFEPHWPARLLLRSGARRALKRELVRPQKVPALLPCGPPPAPPDYAHTNPTSMTKEAVSQAATAWYKAAHAEWAALLNAKPPRCLQPKFRWVPAVGHLAEEDAGSSRPTVLWRSMAKRLHEVAAWAPRQRSDYEEALVQKHLARIRDAVTEICTLRPEAANATTAWHAAVVAAAAAGVSETVWQLSLVAVTKAAKEEALNRAKHTKRFTAASKNGTIKTTSPSRQAYTWSRGGAGWVHSPVGPEWRNDDVTSVGDTEHDDLEAYIPAANAESQCDGEARAPLHDQAQVEAEADGWAKQWNEGGQYDLVIDPTSSPQLEPLLPWAIRRAALLFPSDTGVGCDNISPRAFARLSDEALQALARLYTAFELVGDWASIINLVLIVLLPKSDGGLRPIGLFPTIIRIWMRARSDAARAWEATHARPYFFGGQGRGAQRAAWQVAFRAEASALVGTHYAQSLLDLVKAFERVPHDLLARAAARHGYNLWLLRLTLAAYRLMRAVGVDGAFSRVVIATRGLTAGSGFATTELRILLIDVMDAVCVAWPMVELAVYVDDITIDAAAPARHVVRIVAGATNFVVEKIQDVLNLEVFKKKSVAVGSSMQIGLKVAMAVRGGHVQHARSSKLLGTGSGGGRRRASKVLDCRTKNFKRRIARFHVLRRSRVNTAAMARAAGAPAVSYGADITGMGDTTLHAARSAVARAGTAPAAGKNVDCALYALDADGGSTDPAFAVHLLPICNWAMAAWQQWQPPALMARALAIAQARLRTTESPWSIVTGPVTAVVASACRLGWTFDTPTLLRDDRGGLLDITLDPPAAIAASVRRSVRRWRLARIVAHCPPLLPERADSGIAENRQFYRGAGAPARLPADAIDLSRAVGRLLRKRTQSDICKHWETKHKPYLVSAMCNGQWPQTRLAGTRNWTDDGQCQLCRSAMGTLWHRTCCPATTPADGWQQPDGPAGRFIGRIHETRLRVLYTRGLLIARVSTPPKPAGDSLRWLWRHPQLDADAAHWYIDGSMYDGVAYECIRVGFGIVAVSPCGDLLGVAHGVPPHWVDSAPGAELWALRVVLGLCSQPPPIVTDCMGLLHGMQAGESISCGPKRSHARTWGMIFNVLDGVGSHRLAADRIVWMPAHGAAASTINVAVKSDGTVVTARDWRSNRLVDAAAKLAASEDRVSLHTRTVISDAFAAAEFGAALAGATTFAANNLRQEVVTSSGQTSVVTRRDSAALRGPQARQRVTATQNSPAAHVAADASIARSRVDLSAPSRVSLGHTSARPTASSQAANAEQARRRCVLAAANSKATLDDARFMRNWKNDLASRLQPVERPSDFNRFEALRERVKARATSGL